MIFKNRLIDIWKKYLLSENASIVYSSENVAGGHLRKLRFKKFQNYPVNIPKPSQIKWHALAIVSSASYLYRKCWLLAITYSEKRNVRMKIHLGNRMKNVIMKTRSGNLPRKF